MQPFPAHFHEHYVLGLVERGERRLSCRGEEFTLRAGDLLLLNPGDSHACEQCGGETLDYRSLTITQSVMRSLSDEITGTDPLPRFSPNVLRDSEAACELTLPSASRSTNSAAARTSASRRRCGKHMSRQKMRDSMPLSFFAMPQSYSFQPTSFCLPPTKPVLFDELVIRAPLNDLSPSSARI